MDIFNEIVKRRASPGVLVFDMEGHLLYSNQDALEMIAALGENDLTEAGSEFFLPAEIVTLCQEASRQLMLAGTDNGGQLPRAVLVSESGLALSLRALTMGDHGKERTPSHVMVLIERIIKKHEADFEKAEKDFFLTRRETEVLKLICQGNTNREIAKNLFVCEDTVKGHIKKVMQKMMVNSRSEIIVALK
jgi:DNA-binding NarL/FixJ family response regulator